MQQVAHCCRLIVAMLDEQPAARPQMTCRTANDPANTRQTIAAGDAIGQCHLRLKRQAVALQMRIRIRNIWRVGHDQIAAHVVKRRVPVTDQKPDVGRVLRGIGTRHLDRCRRKIDPGDLGHRARTLQGHRHDTRTGTQIDNLRRLHRPAAIDRQFDQQFSFGPWNQHRGGNQKLAAIEVRRAQKIGQWLAAGATFDEGIESGGLPGRQGARRMGDKIGMRAGSQVLDEQARIKPIDALTG